MERSVGCCSHTSSRLNWRLIRNMCEHFKGDYWYLSRLPLWHNSRSTSRKGLVGIDFRPSLYTPKSEGAGPSSNQAFHSHAESDLDVPTNRETRRSHSPSTPNVTSTSNHGKVYRWVDMFIRSELVKILH